MTLPRMPARRGFTLIEIAVVLLLVATLAAIAIVAVTGAREQNEMGQAAQAIEAVTLVEVDFANRYGVYTAWADDLPLPDGPAAVNTTSSTVRTVSVAITDTGVLGLASGNGDQCLLRVVAAPTEPSVALRADLPERYRDTTASVRVHDFLVPAHSGCSGASALGLLDPAADPAPTLLTPQSRVPA